MGKAHADESRGSVVYLDVVISNGGKVLYNNTPDNVREWVIELREQLTADNAYVMKGYNLHAYSVAEYLSFTKA